MTEKIVDFSTTSYILSPKGHKASNTKSFALSQAPILLLKEMQQTLKYFQTKQDILEDSPPVASLSASVCTLKISEEWLLRPGLYLNSNQKTSSGRKNTVVTIFIHVICSLKPWGTCWCNSAMSCWSQLGKHITCGTATSALVFHIIFQGLIFWAGI